MIEQLKKEVAEALLTPIDDEDHPELATMLVDKIDALIVARINDALMHQRVIRENPAPYNSI